MHNGESCWSIQFIGSTVVTEWVTFTTWLQLTTPSSPAAATNSTETPMAFWKPASTNYNLLLQVLITWTSQLLLTSVVTKYNQLQFCTFNAGTEFKAFITVSTSTAVSNCTYIGTGQFLPIWNYEVENSIKGAFQSCPTNNEHRQHDIRKCSSKIGDLYKCHFVAHSQQLWHIYQTNITYVNTRHTVYFRCIKTFMTKSPAGWLPRNRDQLW